MSFLAGHHVLDQGFHSHDSHRLPTIVLSAIAILAAGFLSRAGLQSLQNHRQVQESEIQSVAVLPEAPVGSIRLNKTEVAQLTLESAREVAAMNRESQTLVNKEISFARTEARAYQNLLTDLNSRLAVETSPVNQAKMKLEIANLEDRVNDTNVALRALATNTTKAKAKTNVFLREDLHGSLLAMQDAGHRAVMVFTNGDLSSESGTDSDDGSMFDPQTFKVSRTGQ